PLWSIEQAEANDRKAIASNVDVEIFISGSSRFQSGETGVDVAVSSGCNLKRRFLSPGHMLGL
ncbi:MAG: hypothetical protein ACI9KE_005141, partial [Polyangiales bacterium]